MSASGQPLGGTQPLTMQGDLAAQMVAGIDRYLSNLTAASIAGRAQYWQRDYSSYAAYARSIEPNRERFKKIIGLVDKREPAHLEVQGWIDRSGRSETLIAHGNGYKVY